MKQIIRKFLVASAAAAAIALASNSAMAESRVNVPFNFTIGHKTLPAGQYKVQASMSRNLVTLTSEETSSRYSFVLAPGDPSPTSQAVVLKFDTANETHALRTIQYGSQITPRLDRGHDRHEHPTVNTIVGQ